MEWPSKDWEVVIGLETHTQLKTRSKIFSGSSIAFGAEPNTQANAVDIALPGVLPVLNKEAVHCAVKFGLAVNAEIAPRSVFARKNYFYPDLPKGYQISQYELPVVGKGSLHIEFLDPATGQMTDSTIRITRAHLEEDAGKSLHGDFEGMSGIDLNRAGTPLLEIVTEPDMRSAAEAVAYTKKLHGLVQGIGICDGNMEEGSFRCDVNVSVRKKGSEKLGTRREIKNLNSFKFMQQAIEYETQWQIETLEGGGTIHQATVLFNPDTGETRAMRSKEEANDYRYFPDPDLLPLQITAEDITAIKATMPETSELMVARFMANNLELLMEYRKQLRLDIKTSINQVVYGLPRYDAEQLVLNRELANYFEETVKLVGKQHAKLVANWVIGSIAVKFNEEENVGGVLLASPQQLAGLLKRIADNSISNKIAKEVFEAMWAGEGDADTIIEKKGLKQVSDSGAIEAIVDEVLAANAAMVAEVRAGKEKAFNGLVGQVMKASKGKANPAQVNEILRKKLAG